MKSEAVQPWNMKASKRSMDFLLGEGLNLSTLVSDRHLQIAKHMREKLIT